MADYKALKVGLCNANSVSQGLVCVPQVQSLKQRMPADLQGV